MTQPKTASKFTPGPWDVHSSRVDAYTFYVYRAAHSQQEMPLDDRGANTRLIAKAPEMYELLEHVVAAGIAPGATNSLSVRCTDVEWVKAIREEACRIKAAIDGEG